MKKKHYILTAVISYFVLLIATIPAKPVTEYINNNSNIIIEGVSGSLWNGRAYAIVIDGQAELQHTRWSFKPWKLLTGKIAVLLDTNYLGNNISTEASLSLTGYLFLNNLNASLTAKQLTELANIPLVQLDGLFEVNIKSAQWKHGKLPLATGIINWTNAKVTVAESAHLGNISIILSESEQQTLSANISNKGGDINISGTADLLPDESYAVDLKFTPTASTKNSLKQSLGMFAKKQSNGDFLLKNTGSIKKIGLM